MAAEKADPGSKTAGRGGAHDPDANKGAVEGHRPEDKERGNPNAPAVDPSGLPSDATAVAEDRTGANLDDSEVANADELGRTDDEERDELKPLD
jgi:hypothetical protein